MIRRLRGITAAIAVSFVLAFCLNQAAGQMIVAQTGGESNQASSETSWLEIIFSGGIIGIAIMLFLISLSITAAYLIIDHLLSIRRSELLPNGLNEQVRKLLLAGRVEEAEQACRDKPSFLAFVLLRCIPELEFGWSALEKTLEDTLVEQSARLYRKVEYLSVVGNVAPMVGLLGTVVGMLLAFKEVASSQGTATASELAQGIYQALVTTVVGLIIAIPSLLALAVFRNRVDQIVADAAYMAQYVFAPLRKKKSRTPTAN
jgi:biopolymer transport protein ExbB